MDNFLGGLLAFSISALLLGLATCMFSLSFSLLLEMKDAIKKWRGH